MRVTFACLAINIEQEPLLESHDHQRLVSSLSPPVPTTTNTPQRLSRWYANPHTPQQALQLTYPPPPRPSASPPPPRTQHPPPRRSAPPPPPASTILSAPTSPSAHPPQKPTPPPAPQAPNPSTPSNRASQPGAPNKTASKWRCSGDNSGSRSRCVGKWS